MKKNYCAIPIIGLAGVLLGANAYADDAADIEATGPTGASGVTYDNYSGSYPVITAILSAPGISDGYTYKNWAFLASDGTGSIDVFSPSSAASFSGFTPAVGDAITVTGNYAPFDGIPEMSTISSIGAISTGNPVGSPVVATIPGLNVNANNSVGLAGTYAGQYVQLDNVMITGAPANFPTHATGTYGVTDGVNSMVLFYWASSYSTDGALGGTPIPTGLVDMDGFVDTFTSTSGSFIGTEAEFVPTSITPVVPEPSVLNLLGIGSALSFVSYRFRRKA